MHLLHITRQIPGLFILRLSMDAPPQICGRIQNFKVFYAAHDGWSNPEISLPFSCLGDFLEVKGGVWIDWRRALHKTRDF